MDTLWRLLVFLFFCFLDFFFQIELEGDAGPVISSSAIYPEQGHLLQLHAHAPSEHTVNGQHFPLEMHFVHQTPSGRLAVVGFLFQLGDHNGWLDQYLTNNLPQNASVPRKPVSLEGVYPSLAQGAFAQYSGSLTTPGCLEGAVWHVYLTPLEASAEQIARYPSSLSPPSHPTNRAVQALNGRTVYTVDSKCLATGKRLHCHKR